MAFWWFPVGESDVGWRRARPFLFKLNDAVGKPKKPLHVFVIRIFTNGFEEKGKGLVCLDDHAREQVVEGVEIHVPSVDEDPDALPCREDPHDLRPILATLFLKCFDVGLMVAVLVFRSVKIHVHDGREPNDKILILKIGGKAHRRGAVP